MHEQTRRQAFRTLVGAAAACQLQVAGEPWRATVFRAGEDGYHTFRIPALIETRRRTLLAFCEGRRLSSSDSGDIDLVMKRSQDGGRTWSGLKLVCDMGPNTIGNPCPVQDRKTGRILLPLTYNPGNVVERQMIERTVEARRTVHITHSDDDGETWAAPRDITASTAKPDWTWYATGPGVGIQMRSGRIVIPCDHVVEGTREHFSHVILSDDGGAQWRLGGNPETGGNECQVVELPDGELMLNMRNAGRKNQRIVSHSADGGMTWSPLKWDETLIEPVCQASLIAAGKLLYFSNPASTRRAKMTVRTSSTRGRTWTAGQVLHEGPSAYSCLAPVGSKDLGCLYECGEKSSYEQITFARFRRKWVNG
ncbi:MAG TPA: sialidase family protein [Bryobacteraceae bacterium]|nr:sialidase family protein [Bryobacteraceae bacterium]HPT27092.1 sialidase family protein [Bryobacteraceae bacterium]